MKPHRSIRYTLISVLVSGLLGCSTTSELSFTTQAEESLSVTNMVMQRELNLPANAVEQPAVLLTDLIGISELDKLIATAMNSNPGLQQSVVALKIAYEQQDISYAARIPSASASFSGTAKENSDESYNADLTVSWELDLWQRLDDSNNAALKDVAASTANLQAAKDLLAANIMRGWLDISLKQQLLAIEQKRLAILKDNESLILQRYRAGLDNLEDLDSAKSSSASSSATVADYSEQLAKSRRSLMMQLGQISSEPMPFPEISSEFPQVIYPLDEMQSQNLQRRPDLRAAFYNIEAEALRTDAAYKAMLLSINLSASLSDVADTPSQALFASPLWSLLGSISAPLFQGDKLRSQAEIAQLTTEKSYWTYQETLLTAVNEVENALGQEKSLQRQQSHIRDALASAKRSSVTYEEKYRQGLATIFDLLTAQQKTFDLESQLTQMTYNRLSNRIDLGLALGLGASS
ncbi:TolC family protein [Vibrio sp. SCSIO 43137]|uniref:TolC family protein n=1 Tax=Vibrio sp. SCSIO 43137 TaxID=3021011 RepID=UPI002307EA68|nr:TolC family protein [Vibrio sp. SCSIO 43137]WCE31569.1 TolC family protein [Vibrio sp. SCSIO 43137]